MTARSTIVTVACLALSVAALVGLLFLSGFGERYCYFYPSIDTTYAVGYSGEDFSKLTVGMTMAEVDGIMCKPLHVERGTDGVTRVIYTQDGKALIGDFAWFGRSLYIRDGKVTKIGSTTYYD